MNKQKRLRQIARAIITNGKAIAYNHESYCWRWGKAWLFPNPHGWLELFHTDGKLHYDKDIGLTIENSFDHRAIAYTGWIRDEVAKLYSGVVIRQYRRDGHYVSVIDTERRSPEAVSCPECGRPFIPSIFDRSCATCAHEELRKESDEQQNHDQAHSIRRSDPRLPSPSRRPGRARRRSHRGNYSRPAGGLCLPIVSRVAPGLQGITAALRRSRDRQRLYQGLALSVGRGATG